MLIKILLVFVAVAAVGCGALNTTVADNSNSRIAEATPNEQPTRPAIKPTPLKPPDRYKYNSKIDYIYGLYYAVGDEDSSRKIIISETNQPIPPKANDPGEDTIPGFYLSHGNPLDFEEIEVVGNKISFKTRGNDSEIIYNFRGSVKLKTDQDFSEPIPFIEGTLQTTRDGNIIKKEEVSFGHAVIY